MGTFSIYFQSNISKLIFHLRLSDHLPDVLLQELYIDSTYIIDLRI